MSRVYLEVPAGMITPELIAEAVETSADTVRYSNDSLYAVLKFDGDVPATLSGLDQYTLDEFAANILTLERWEPPA
jgi:hypothetical protein